MIIVNTTFILHISIAEQLLTWMKHTYFESALRKGAVNKPLIAKVLNTDDAYSETYAMHIYFPDIETALNWDDGYGSGLRRILTERCGEKALTFHTFLEVTE